ncbi:unnamed protein product [Rotaria sp. Silwood1]|nr:unnamed protein product [Rotaria sp. Silwood1]CAF3334076.1 unnamed protein product [Rotaria sp. Silwood1]CAF3355395.1 unnamed protein product [Rotaria sp. Silwood1]CAF4484179.1 unnamed protein product [Rotaria sp. Silwood1]CAF4511362.1 unnamed protein product [Rotaria sp. Silwood1]
MSILLKWKNKLHDPSLYETKIREFDERVSVLKSENVELHKRIDQLEALCTTSVDTQQTHFLEEHIRQLEQENGRLFAENQCQRQEYERFLDQLTTMVLRTAVLQENIRKECASIYHVIERLSTLTTNAIEDKHSNQIGHRPKRLRSLSWENLKQSYELISNYQLLSTSPETTAEFIRHLYQNRSSLSSSSSSSCSSATTHCSFSTSGSWTLDLSLYNKNRKIQSPILPISNELIESQPKQKEENEQQQQQQQEETTILQRSETFVVSKIPQEQSSSTTSDVKIMTNNERNINPNVQRCPVTRTITATASTVVRPSRLPSRCSINRNTNVNNSSNSKTPLSNNNKNTSRSLSVNKASKLPVRTITSSTKQVTSVKKSNISTPVTTMTKKDSTITSTRTVTSVNNTTTKKTIHPVTTSKPSAVQDSSSKSRSRSITTVNNNKNNKNNKNTSIQPSLNKHTRTTPPIVKKSTIETVISSKKIVKPIEEKSICSIEQMNSTSSESSIEENQQRNKLLTTIQDEGYSTWSSSDVKDDIRLNNNLKKNIIEERRRNTGLVKNWLDTSNKRCTRKPVNEVDMDKLEEFTRELSDTSSFICPFVRNRCSNGVIIPLASTTLSSSLPSPLADKDISLDSLDGADSPQPKDQTITSSSSSSSSSSTTFSHSETFDKLVLNDTLPIITDDLADSTDSTCSDLNQLFNISEYIEDNFIDQDDNCDQQSSSYNTSIKSHIQIKKQPQKRLMFPGLLNRLIFLRRVLSDSDLRQKLCCIGENEIQFHVYHSNTINEHSVELNLMNTYGSESELHVWSHDCAEQRRFANERQQQSLITSNQPQSKLSHIERMIRMTLDDNEEDETNLFESDNEEYDQQLALERQTLLQQIYEYPWLLQGDDIDQATIYTSPNSEQPLLSPSPDIVVPSHNPDFYQLCALTNSSSFATSYGTNSRHTTPPIASSVL